MTKEDFREMLRKLEIAINDNEDTDSITEVQRYELYKLDLENKFSETDIAITTVDELMLLEQAASIEDFKEDLQTYRASLDANLNATPQNVDNYADFESINVKITEMKAMVAELQSFINEYKKNKSNLSETERTAKEKEIDEKQAAIEAKRKEIQAIIDKIKKVWTDINFVDITDPTIKTTLQKQKEKEEKWIKNYQKNLDNVITPASTFREKLNNTGKKTW
jgi:hypothetical protein